MEFRYPYDTATGLPGDGTDPWQNGDPQAGIDGSIPPAEAFNDPQREICNVVDHFLGDGSEGSGQAAGDLTQLLQSIQEAVAAGGVPIGTEIHWTGDTAPARYLAEDRSAVSRVTYAALWAHAQASGMYDATGVDTGMFGPGDGSTTFDLPDARAEFLRGWDDGRGVDAGRALGSSQADELASHAHDYDNSLDGGRFYGVTNEESGHGATFTSATASTGGAETRPRNIARLICIRAL